MLLKALLLRGRCWAALGSLRRWMLFLTAKSRAGTAAWRSVWVTLQTLRMYQTNIPVTIQRTKILFSLPQLTRPGATLVFWFSPSASLLRTCCCSKIFLCALLQRQAQGLQDEAGIAQNRLLCEVRPSLLCPT